MVTFISLAGFSFKWSAPDIKMRQFPYLPPTLGAAKCFTHLNWPDAGALHALNPVASHPGTAQPRGPQRSLCLAVDGKYQQAA